MVATFCPDCGEWVNGNWSEHDKNCKMKRKRKNKELPEKRGQ